MQMERMFAAPRCRFRGRGRHEPPGMAQGRAIPGGSHFCWPGAADTLPPQAAGLNGIATNQCPLTTDN
ncbi:MAG: hypothetical protein CMJ58_07200 [Planctomycetaceae bacterium]|nr:hypothetical protein [Planctomycetaceae bacterium]